MTSRVFVIDEQPCFVEGLSRAVVDDPCLAFVGSSPAIQEGLDEALAVGADIVLVDVALADFDASAFRRRLEGEGGRIKAMALSHLRQRSLVQQVFASGMTGYVLKRSPPCVILAAMRHVLAGEAHLDPALFREMGLGPDDKPDAARLASTTVEISQREMAVLKLSALGHSCKEIARDLGVSPKSVEVYKARALHKLGLETRVDIVRFASVCGWFAAVH